jgi:hypothetical protein
LKIFVEGEVIELLSGAFLGNALRKPDAYPTKGAIMG